MPVTLAQAQLNTAVDIDYAVMDNLRRYSWLLDRIVFDDTVTPGTGGGTLTYGYTRLKTVRTAAFRAYNTEYSPSEAERERVTVELHPHGGAFNVDRVLSRLGPGTSNEITFQMQQLLTATQQKWQEELINGDTAVDSNGFDGLDKSLTGTATEYDPLDNGTSAGYLNWTASTINSQALAMAALDQLDEFLSLITPSKTGGGDAGSPGALPPGEKAILGNRKSITRIRALARWAALYTADKDTLGRRIERYQDWALVDIGDGQAGTSPIIPVYSEDADEGGGGSTITGLTDIYAVTFGLDALHGASVAGIPLVQTWMPDFAHAGAVKSGEIEMGPSAMVLKNTKACGVLRKVKVQ
ncbi:phage major capsid protein [Streptomyces sp. PKU-MA01144]|uniref:major capsid protein n=1 Tax=Streptomyces sp. PKU-MA01144 TaxID=2729138 RepID=UPI001480F899|nr:phage major capsid protein [Streptomyces sp. PKU-MA01144]NNJ04154.1 phage major capsid protein [Streptomyces sp. PKU-MA01144]